MPDTMTPVETHPYENRSATISELTKALCKAQGEMDNAAKDQTNTHFNSKYADLASVWNAIRKPLSDNGLAVVQFPRTVQNGVEIETTLWHSSGEFLRDVLWVPCSKMDAQGLGSAVTYGRKYALMAVAGIAPAEDDDGNAAVATTPKNVTPPPRPGPRDSSANGRRMAGDEPHLIDHDRPKGSMGNKEPTEPAHITKAKRIAMDWSEGLIVQLNESEMSLDALTELKESDDFVKRSAWMKDAMPDQYSKLKTVLGYAEERATSREAA